MKHFVAGILLGCAVSGCSTYSAITFDDIGSSGSANKTVRIQLSDGSVYESSFARTRGDTLEADVVREGVMKSRMQPSGSVRAMPKWFLRHGEPDSQLFVRSQVEAVYLESGNVGSAVVFFLGVPVMAFFAYLYWNGGIGVSSF